jgi:CelD/BcsL family acetyltransferase involved in cellulose biosynthesis
MSGAMAPDGREMLTGQSLAELSTGLTATVASPVGADGIAAYSVFCETALFAPAQSPAWVRHWVEQAEPDALFATLSDRGKPVLALALEVVRSGPFGIARFMAGTHANGNFPPSDPEWIAAAAMPTTLRPLFRAIAKARPDIDVIALERLQPDLGGRINPLRVLPDQKSPNVALAADLRGGFESLLGRASGKRKCKKHRSQIRKFEAIGGARRLLATTPDEVRAFLKAFFAMKETRFRRLGIANVFAGQPVRRFFEALFVGSLAESEPPFLLHALEAQGQLRAVTGSSRCGARLICEFGAISEDAVAPIGPGDFLFFENIREACEQGFRFYDFSVGDELYKRQWCDTEIWHTDALVPLSFKGHFLAFALRRTARLKSIVKNNPLIWKLVKRLRRGAAGGRPDAIREDD